MKTDNFRKHYEDNPLRTREDFQQYVRDLFEPLVPYYEEGVSRVILGPTGAMYDEASEGVEAYIRPIWALAPLAAGGGEFAHWDLIRRGLIEGTDPSSEYYWGEVGATPFIDATTDQRMVEMAAFGFALALAPEEFFEPLTDEQKQNVYDWLAPINTIGLRDNNWQFFRVLVNLGLERVGGPTDWAAAEESLATLESNYLGDGWYRDGEWQKTTDFYIPFAFHFYSLIYAKLRADKDPERAQLFIERAKEFAPDWAARFDSKGRVIAYGRSMTYRFAGAGFFGALAFADAEGIPWAEMRGLWAKHLRWFRSQDIFDKEGILTIGWGYQNLLMSESYNAPGSPYWALKAFLPLALPADHPFWTAQEAEDAGTSNVHKPQPHAHMIANRTDTQAQVLNAGGPGFWFPRHATAKYGKLAYSSAFPFVLEPDDLITSMSAESNLTFLDPETFRRETRTRTESSGVDGDVAWSQWQVFDGAAKVTTVLAGEGDQHVRVHVVDLERPLTAIEGGFAIEDRYDPATDEFRSDCTTEGSVRAQVGNDNATSLIVDPTGIREPSTPFLQPNTSLQWSRSIAPILQTKLEPGQHVLVTGVRANETKGDLSVDFDALLTDEMWEVLEKVYGKAVERP